MVRNDLGSQNKAYMADISLGQQRNKNDLQVGCAWNRIDQDAVLAPFVESDQRTQTNVLQQWYLRVFSRLRSNTTAAYTLLGLGARSTPLYRMRRTKPELHPESRMPG